MTFLTLIAIAEVIGILNRSRYLQQYKCTTLPSLPFLVLLATAPLAIVDRKITDWRLHLMWLVLVAVGILLSFIDRERHLLPDRLILPFIPFALLAAGVSGNLKAAIIGGLGWFVTFALLALINPAGLGWGDVKFAALLGIACGALGLRQVPVAALLGLFAGALYAMTAIIRGQRQRRIAFGPFMFAGAVASLISLT